MQRADELERENRELRDLLSRLSRASLRINESLDFDRVLQGVLDSARVLTSARYGVITVRDEAGMPQDFLSSGMTAEEARRIWETPDGMSIFHYLSQRPEPLRIPDLLGHLRSRGLPQVRLPAAVESALSFLAAPILQQGRSVGNIYVAKSEAGDEFSRENENTLVMFASQAAMVIANARQHRDEQRARADLETLVNTAPVGVVVLDAPSGAPVTFNREARRIVDALRDADQSPEQLLEVITLRRADGREVSLDELPLSQALGEGETVRAEEVVLRVPDGRSVTTLVNATPIRSDDGTVESFVVTLQDMTHLEALERLRAEFLAMVSHELRTPLVSIKGSTATVLGGSAAFGPAEMMQFFRIIDQQADHLSGLINDLLDAALIETGTLAVNPEPALLAALVEQARSAFLGGGVRRDVRIDLPPDLPRVSADPRRIVQVLGNLLSNAARHSPEALPIRVSAARGDFHVAVTVEDQGSGLSPERLSRLFRKFSRIEAGDTGGDTGLGLAICRGIVEAHGGRIWAESDGPDRGSRFTFTLPVAEEALTGVAVTSGQPAAHRPERDEPARILVVDDDPLALRHIRDALARAGYAPITAGDPAEAAKLMAARDPHLVLLDLMLPGTDGIELMLELRDVADVPFIFLSAYGQEDVVARAFDTGAEDYVVKPFSSTELAARIRAALRRRAAALPSQPYVRGDLVVDRGGRNVTVAGCPVRLTALEYGLLAELAAHAGTTLTYTHLAERVWNRPASRDVRRMRSAVRSLRRKLGDDADNPFYIFTHPRVGYRMAPGEPEKKPRLSDDRP
ncbi:MAG: response regulator [Chloroflexota bacterium]|nr:response regulator [Chloroflexota bacterium]